MFESFGGGAGFGGGMIAGGMIQDLLRGAGSYEDWAGVATEVATSAQASFRHHLADAEEPNTKELARDLDRIGREAQRLAIIAENRNYGDEEVELMRRLDKLCLRFTNGAPNTDRNPRELIRDELPQLVGDIFDTIDAGTRD